MLFNVFTGGIIAVVGLLMIIAGKKPKAPVTIVNEPKNETRTVKNLHNEELEIELNKIKDLFDRGIITEEEYKAKRKKILNID
jgi:hypothetical protein